MNRKPEYLKFVDVDAGKRKTRVVEVRSVSSDVVLGRIAWYGPWRQYNWWPERDTTFNADCLFRVATELRQMMRDRAEARRG